MLAVMKTRTLSILSIVLGVAVPVAGTESFGFLVGHSPLPQAFEANFPILGGVVLLALGWFPFVVVSSIILVRFVPHPAWWYAGLSALTITVFYFYPFSSNPGQALTLPHALSVLVLGWLVVPLTVFLGQLRLTSRSRPTR